MSLVVTSQRITAEKLGISLFTDLLGSNSSCFIQNGEGLIAWGQAQKLSAIGANRFRALDALWQEAVSSANIKDQVNSSGSGLVALGSITFSDNSQFESVLVIPNLIIGFSNGEYFATTVNLELDQALELIRRPVKQENLVFTPGSISPELFCENVGRALGLIETNQISKVVLARDLVAKAKDFNPNYALAKLTSKFSSCYTYLVDGTFGASPELLVEVSKRTVKARVLAGTAGRGTDKEVDEAIGEALSHSHKNLSEHEYAIDSLTSSMRELCVEITVSEKPFSLALPNLWHLASDVEAILNSDITSLALLEILHPSAAVAGTPRDKALAVIDSLEKIDRGRYAGPVGWVSANGDGVWAIALRGGQITEDEVTAFAGCGIVAESDPESELAETNLKFKTVLENL